MLQMTAKATVKSSGTDEPAGQAASPACHNPAMILKLLGETHQGRECLHSLQAQLSLKVWLGCLYRP